jgi:hypothetical protein
MDQRHARGCIFQDYLNNGSFNKVVGSRLFNHLQFCLIGMVLNDLPQIVFRTTSVRAICGYPAISLCGEISRMRFPKITICYQPPWNPGFNDLTRSVRTDRWSQIDGGNCIMQSVAIFIGDSQMAKIRLLRMFDFLGDCGSQLERNGVVYDVKSGGCFEQTVGDAIRFRKQWE